MCKNHKHSLEIIKRDYNQYTESCCPSFPHVAEKVPGWEQLEGVYHVISDAKEKLASKIYALDVFDAGDTHEFEIRLYKFFMSLSYQEFMDNLMSKDNFIILQQLLAEKNIRLNKRSPKISNFIQTLVDIKKKEQDNSLLEAIMNDFNDRGSEINKYEMVITTEPHRIAGMSAYGQFSSCQDWIENDEEGEGTHDYTHCAWATLEDPTVGVAFIREKDAPGPEDNEEDMLARSLIRILPLKNGKFVVYFHKIYAISPYHAYLNSSFKELTKQLPDNYFVLNLYEGAFSDNISGMRDGVEVEGCSTVYYNFDGFKSIEVERNNCDECNDGKERTDCDTCEGTGDVKVDCNCCNGEGSIYNEENDDWYTCAECNGKCYSMEDCEDCDGDGYNEETCSNCHGKGYFEDKDIVRPYEDHSNWISFEDDYIEFEVPNFLIDAGADEEDFALDSGVAV